MHSRLRYAFAVCIMPRPSIARPCGQVFDAATRLGEGHPTTKNRKLMAEAGDHVRFEIGAARRLGGKIAFFTAVRDPIGRAVASLFHALPTTIPEYSENYARGGSAFAQMLADGLVAAWQGELEGDKRLLNPPFGPGASMAPITLTVSFVCYWL